MIWCEALPSEFTRVRDFYWDLIDEMSGQENTIGWKKGIYPSDEQLKQSLERGELFTLREGSELSACVILNHEHNEGYDGIEWGIECEDTEVLIPHALAVRPAFQGKGMGTVVVMNILWHAKAKNMKTVRLDLLAGNEAAKHLYTGVGFRFVTSREMFYEDTGWTEYMMYEYIL